MPSRAAAVRRRWPDLRPNPSLLRAWLDLSQAEMAAALGVSVNTWARWERGEREPTGAFAARVMRFLDGPDGTWMNMTSRIASLKMSLATRSEARFS